MHVPQPPLKTKVTKVTLVSLFLTLLSIVPGLRFRLCLLKSSNLTWKQENQNLPSASGFLEQDPEKRILSKAPSDNLNSQSVQYGHLVLCPGSFSAATLLVWA
ncbi:hypothetical protein I79_024452 [Cricetulus griseus]|uniref:Uncharacterized protein n=1 Tax=Cricetulus griseus TaxID=10029 RepID=G3IKP9_CRIGR|nr:hypothetical protein I79_024452 [Cricetulus griseus]